MINIRSALEQGLSQLNLNNTDARLEAEILLATALNSTRTYIYAHPEQELNPNQVTHYQNLIQQRAQGTPIAYLTGTRDFWSLTLNVNPHTLIPRHETERLVELALELIPDKPNTQILDLGTGSGAIALALAKEKPHWQIDACDRSQEALDTALGNAQKNGITSVNFYLSDWFKQIPPKRYHAILSNPPYIAEKDPHLNQGDLRFEPQNALVSGQDGFADLQYILEHALNWLLPSGLVLVEHGFEQKLKLKSIINGLGYKNAHTWQDMHGHDRVSGGWTND
ncbi:MAG: peptide chain release factor N(5)-glutamine methyltransferase [Legionella sp.]|jgi:release factor glutamine methyltransferase